MNTDTAPCIRCGKPVNSDYYDESDWEKWWEYDMMLR
jgi:hypothetical protein